MSLTPKQLAARRLGIGGSDAAAALGLPSAWKTRYQLWAEKTGQQEEERPEAEARMHWGNLLEDAVATHMAQEEGAKLQRVRTTLFSTEHPFMCCNVDRAFVNPQIAKVVRFHNGRLTTDRIAEIKTTRRFDPEDWGDENTDEIPLAYIVQAVHMLIVTKVPLCVVGALAGGQEYRRYQVRPRPDIVEMVVEGERVFDRMVRERTPPEVTTLEDVGRRWRQDDGGSIEATEEIAAALDELRLAQAQADTDTEAVEKLKVQIESFMGSNANLTIRGINAATWKSVTQERIDSKLLRKRYPEIAAEVTKESASRRFLLKEIDNE